VVDVALVPDADAAARRELEVRDPALDAEVAELRLFAVDEHVVLGQVARVAQPDAMAVRGLRAHGAVERRDGEQAVLLQDDAARGAVGPLRRHGAARTRFSRGLNSGRGPRGVLRN